MNEPIDDFAFDRSVADDTVVCARCGHAVSVSQATPEEGDEWECLPCNSAHDRLERLEQLAARYLEWADSCDYLLPNHEELKRDFRKAITR